MNEILIRNHESCDVDETINHKIGLKAVIHIIQLIKINNRKCHRKFF